MPRLCRRSHSRSQSYWLADGLRRAGEPIQAKDHAEQALHLLGHVRTTDHLAEVHNVLSQISAALGDAPAAFGHHLRALNLAQRIEYRLEAQRVRLESATAVAVDDTFYSLSATHLNHEDQLLRLAPGRTAEKFRAIATNWRTIATNTHLRSEIRAKYETAVRRLDLQAATTTRHPDLTTTPSREGLDTVRYAQRPPDGARLRRDAAR